MSDETFFLVVDLMGFGSIVQNSTDTELDDRIDAWVDLVNVTANKLGIERIQLISDTLFASTPARTDDLIKLIDFSRQLLIDGMEQSFPIRGAIVHGKSSWGKMTYGPAVISAHQLEQTQNWIGISCAPDLPGIETLWSIDRLVCYPPPLKNAQIRLHPVVSWPIPSVERLMRLLMGGGLTKKGDVINWQLGEKVNNTILYSMYLQILRNAKADPSKFHGLLPVHPISSVIMGE